MQKKSQEVLLVGGGHSHVEVLRSFGMRGCGEARVTIVSATASTPYSGMLPGFVAGHYSHDDIHIDLGPLSAFANARLWVDRVTEVDIEKRLVLFAKRPPASFDVLSINIGAAPSLSTPGVSEFAIPVKPISDFSKRWNEVLSSVSRLDRKIKIVVVGAGAGGVELAFAIDQKFRTLGIDAEISLISRGSLLPTFAGSVRKKTRKTFERKRIAVLENTGVLEVSKEGCQTSNGEFMNADVVFWCVSAAAQPWLRNSGFPVDDRGFVKVDKSLSVEGMSGIFAAGDTACFSSEPLPKAGVFAVRQGPILADNIRAAACGAEASELKTYKPQRHFLSLIAAGDKSAILSRGAVAFEGSAMWTLKDQIDTRFMRKYSEFPSMEEPEGAPKMQCLGCGSKVGALELEHALSEIAPFKSESVVESFASGNDSAVSKNSDGSFSLHSIDGFVAPVEDPYLFGKIATHHALSDVYAAGGIPKTVLAHIVVPFGSSIQMESDLRGILVGANHALLEDKVALIGGHTTHGEKMSMTLSVSGERANMEKPRPDPAAGDLLILTKPLGSGVLFAGSMRGEPCGDELYSMLETISRSQRADADVLLRFGTSFVTDVTGFGLAVHLMRLAKRHSLTCEINLEKLPMFQGVEVLLKRGIRSTLAPNNETAAMAEVDFKEVSSSSRYPILFDPQTSGGLLFSVPEAAAENCLEAIHSGGTSGACVIGRITPTSGSDAIVTVKP